MSPEAERFIHEYERIQTQDVLGYTRDRIESELRLLVASTPDSVLEEVFGV
jgi:hypothetical protein